MRATRWSSVILGRSVVLLLAYLQVAAATSAAEKVPPAPTRYFNDYAALVPTQVAEQLNRQLEDFERQTSNQILVAIYPKFPSETSLEDYTQQVARSWKAGSANGRDNAAILFVFVQDRKIRIEVGRALEGALPDVICKRIISEQVAPRFRNGDFAGGVSAGEAGRTGAAKRGNKGNREADEARRGGQAAHAAWVIPTGC